MVIDNTTMSKLLENHITAKYSDKVVFVGDESVSYFDMDDVAPTNPKILVFDTLYEFLKMEESGELWNKHNISILYSLSMLYVNGVRDREIISILRG